MAVSYQKHDSIKSVNRIPGGIGPKISLSSTDKTVTLVVSNDVIPGVLAPENCMYARIHGVQGLSGEFYSIVELSRHRQIGARILTPKDYGSLRVFICTFERKDLWAIPNPLATEKQKKRPFPTFSRISWMEPVAIPFTDEIVFGVYLDLSGALPAPNPVKNFRAKKKVSTRLPAEEKPGLVSDVPKAPPHPVDDIREFTVTWDGKVIMRKAFTAQETLQFLSLFLT